MTPRNKVFLVVVLTIVFAVALLFVSLPQDEDAVEDQNKTVEELNFEVAALKDDGGEFKSSNSTTQSQEETEEEENLEISFFEDKSGEMVSADFRFGCRNIRSEEEEMKSDGKIVASLVIVWLPHQSREELELTVVSFAIACRKVNSSPDVAIAVVGRSREECLALCYRELSAKIICEGDNKKTDDESRVPGLAWHEALRRAQGEWIIFGHAGDYFAQGLMKAGSEAEKNLHLLSEMPGSVAFWNTADSRNGYHLLSEVVAPQFMTSKLPSNAELLAGSFAIRLSALWSQNGLNFVHKNYPKEDTAEAESLFFRSFVALIDPSAISDEPMQKDDGHAASIAFFSNRWIKQFKQSEGSENNNWPDFLSIVVAAGGDRALVLRMMLLALQLQIVQPLEVLVGLGSEDFGQQRMINKFFSKDDKIKFFVAKEQGPYGHATREEGLSMAKGQYVLITNDDNYYPPIFIDTLIQSEREKTLQTHCRQAILHYTVIHAYDYYNYRVQGTKIEFTHIDMGAAVVSTDLAKKVGFGFRHGSGDWDYFAACRDMVVGANATWEMGCDERENAITFVAPNTMLFVHN